MGSQDKTYIDKHDVDGRLFKFERESHRHHEEIRLIVDDEVVDSKKIAVSHPTDLALLKKERAVEKYKMAERYLDSKP